MNSLFSIGLILAIGITGCASRGFNRGSLQNQIGVAKSVTRDQDIKEILSRKPNLPRPFKLAVYFKKPAQKEDAVNKWRWTDQDRNLILESAKEMGSQNLISEVFPIVGSMVDAEDLKSIRVAAAKHGADAVLVIDGVGEIDRYINDWGWLYILLVKTAFVSGSEADTLFLTSAAMWDVRNEYLYLSSEAEGKASNRHIALFGDKDAVLLERAKTASLQKLKGEIINMVKGIKK